MFLAISKYLKSLSTIKTLVFLGEPITFNGVCQVYPPSVKEIVANSSFSLYEKMLTLSDENIQDLLKDKISSIEDMPSPLKFLLENARYNAEFEEMLQAAFQSFVKEKVKFLYDEVEIRLKSKPNKIFITEDNFFDFSNIIRVTMGGNKIKPPEPIDPNEDPRIRAMKEKIRKRDKIKEKQMSKKGVTLETSLAAICCMGLGITPLNIGEMSYGAIRPIITMMQNKEKYDTDIRCLLAGADSKKIKPEYWIRNFDKE